MQPLLKPPFSLPPPQAQGFAYVGGAGEGWEGGKGAPLPLGFEPPQDRKKYYQGIKFYDPEIVGDTPETVEYVGMQNLINALKPTLGTEAPALFAVRPGTEEAVGNPWGPLDDVVMGGVSESGFTVVPGAGEAGEAAGVFYGVVRTENNGGFVSVRTRDYEPGLDLSRYDGLELRVKGDGRRYKMQVSLARPAPWPPTLPPFAPALPGGGGVAPSPLKTQGIPVPQPHFRPPVTAPNRFHSPP